MAVRAALVLLALIIIFGGTFGYVAWQNQQMSKRLQSQPRPPVVVSTTTSIETTWYEQINAIGNVVAVNSVELTPEVSGRVLSFSFQSGEMVEKGQTLVQLDDAIDQHNLVDNSAQLTLSQSTYDRRMKLQRKQAISLDQLDIASALLIRNKSLVAKDKLNIHYKKIRAPFSGKVGIRRVNIGQYVEPGDALVSLQSMDPIYVDFFVPEQFLAQLQVGEDVSVKVESQPDKTFTGKIMAFDSKVSTTTHNIVVRAKLDNPKSLLYPGLFAEVFVELSNLGKKTIVIPQTAISYSLQGDSVFVIENNIAKQRYITISKRRGTMVSVQRGLTAGEQVVISGTVKLRDGATVKVDNSNPLSDSMRQ